jgi:hypothetical protein
MRVGDTTVVVEGELVPVVDIELGARTSVYFEHHILLWKQPHVTAGLHGLAERRASASSPVLQIFISTAQGSGQHRDVARGAGSDRRAAACAPARWSTCASISSCWRRATSATISTGSKVWRTSSSRAPVSSSTASPRGRKVVRAAARLRQRLREDARPGEARRRARRLAVEGRQRAHGHRHGSAVGRRRAA